MPSFRLPPAGKAQLEIKGPPGGRVHVNLEPPAQEIFRDPAGGPPIEVSAWVQPDALAIYVLAAALMDATRAIDDQRQAAERAVEAYTRMKNKWLLGLAGVFALTWLALHWLTGR